MRLLVLNSVLTNFYKIVIFMFFLIGQDENVGVTCKLAHVCIERDTNGSLGITLRGGIVPSNPELNSPLIITQVRTNGPADR